MSLLESIIYGFVSAIAEFLPVSSCAHQILIRYIFGFDTRDPIQDLLVHIGILLSVFVSFKEVIFRLNRSFKSPKRGKRRRHQTEGKNAYDLRLIKTASVPLILGLLLSFVTQAFEENLLYLLAFVFYCVIINLLICMCSNTLGYHCFIFCYIFYCSFLNYYKFLQKD